MIFIIFLTNILVEPSLIRTRRDSIGQNRLGNKVFLHETAGLRYIEDITLQIYEHFANKNGLKVHHIKQMIANGEIDLLTKILRNNSNANKFVRKALRQAESLHQAKPANNRFRNYKRIMNKRSSSKF